MNKSLEIEKLVDALEGAFDIKGSKAGMKDMVRIQDMLTKADGDEFKLVGLADQMATAIQDQDKAYRRADAAKEFLKDKDYADMKSAIKQIVQIFTDRGNELGEGFSEVISHEGGKWLVKSKKGKVLGTHDTKGDALKQLAAVEISKHGG